MKKEYIDNKSREKKKRGNNIAFMSMRKEKERMNE